MEAKFIGNTKTKKLHVVEYANGQCHLKDIRAEQKVAFATLEEAMRYPPGAPPIFHECGVCFPKMKGAKKV